MIFISYSRKDAKPVERLVKKLDEAGFKVWRDVGGIRGGSQWPEEIVRALKTSSIFMLVLSSNSVQSENVLEEFNVARMKKKRLLPVWLEDVEIPDAMQLGLSVMQQLNLFPDFNAGVQELLDVLRQENSPDQPAAEESAAETRRRRLLALRTSNELPAKELAEVLLISTKPPGEFTPTEKLLKEYVDLLLAEKISAQLYLQTRERIYSETTHIRREKVDAPPKLQPIFCIYCGGRNAADNVFCFQCGKKLR